MVYVSEIAENICLIDDQLYSIPRWGSVYLINEEKKALVDTGPTTSASTVLDGIRKVGIKAEHVDYLIVTHIHLDHAGGAGFLIKAMPRAQVVAHHRGSKHLMNPAKLISSVIEAQGEAEMMKNGEVVPIETERLKPVHGGDLLRLSDRQLLEFIDAPGHAPHELCIYESRNHGLFTGDAVGTLTAEVLLPVTQPPSFDAELAINTLERLMKLKAAALYFAHFGVSTKVQENLELAIDKLRAWDDIITKAIEKHGVDGLAERLIAQSCAEVEPVREKKSLYEHLTDVIIPGNVAGFIKYCLNKHEADFKRRNSESSQRED